MGIAVEQRKVVTTKPRVDKALHAIVTAGALASLVILGSIAGFLLYRGFQIFSDMGLGFITGSTWEGSGAEGEVTKYGIAPMLIGSLILSLIAVIVALPLSVGTALFVEFYAPKFLRRILVSVLDLAAAIPSVIYGLWGLFVLRPLAMGWAKSLNEYFGWFPLFSVPGTFFDGSPFLGGLVLAVMISPIITAIAREVFSQTPPELVDGARALGGERWAAIRHIVLPFGRSGVIGGAMLGLGRALGETVAIYLVVSVVFKINFQILFTGSGNIASMIALKFGEASPYEVKALLASGFVLFVVTLLVNFAASGIVNRSAAKVGK